MENQILADHEDTESVQNISGEVVLQKDAAPVSNQCDADDNEKRTAAVVHKKMPRSQRKRLLKELRLANRKEKKQKLGRSFSTEQQTSEAAALHDSHSQDEIEQCGEETNKDSVLEKTADQMSENNQKPSESTLSRLVCSKQNQASPTTPHQFENDLELCTKNKQSSSGQQQFTELSKKQRVALERERLTAALTSGSSQRVAIDLSLEHHMSSLEHSKLAQQLCRVYGANKRARQPVHLHFTGIDHSGPLHAECVRKNAGWEKYIVTMSERAHYDVFSPDEVVYLTPDSNNDLETIERDRVYIIGGLVDESVSNNITSGEASKKRIRTARLPIDRYMERAESGTFSKVLSVNQVFEILLEVSQSGDWRKALEENVPKRTGYRLTEEECKQT